MDVSAKPGRTPARYSRIGTFSRRQLSTMDRMAATFGPACWLPTWIQFLRLWKYFHSRNYVPSRIMCSADLCNHTIIRIDGSLRQVAASGLCA